MKEENKKGINILVVLIVLALIVGYLIILTSKDEEKDNNKEENIIVNPDTKESDDFFFVVIGTDEKEFERYNKAEVIKEDGSLIKEYNIDDAKELRFKKAEYIYTEVGMSPIILLTNDGKIFELSSDCSVPENEVREKECTIRQITSPEKIKDIKSYKTYSPENKDITGSMLFYSDNSIYKQNGKELSKINESNYKIFEHENLISLTYNKKITVNNKELKANIKYFIYIRINNDEKDKSVIYAISDEDMLYKYEIENNEIKTIIDGEKIEKPTRTCEGDSSIICDFSYYDKSGNKVLLTQ